MTVAGRRLHLNNATSPTGTCLLAALLFTLQFLLFQTTVHAESCEREQTIFDSAKADFDANRLQLAARKFRKLKAILTKEKAKLCPRLKIRTTTSLSRIQTLYDEGRRLNHQIERCDVTELTASLSLYASKTHIWFKDAARRARAAIKKCNKETKTRSPAHTAPTEVACCTGKMRHQWIRQSHRPAMQALLVIFATDFFEEQNFTA